MLLDFIKRNKNFLFVDEYCDENISGAGTYRPEFERMIYDCKIGKLDIVLCKSQSRFSRDIEIVEKYINNKFKEWKIRFISLADNIDTEKNETTKTRQINALVNEWYLEDVSNNIKSALKIKMKQGELISPFAPYGFKKNKNILEIDKEASKVVKNIYNLFLSGYNYTSIANYLNNKNIPSPSLYKYQKKIKLNIVSNKPREEILWNNNTIKTILNNEIYIGNLIQGKRTTISYKNHKTVSKDKNNWIRKENTHPKIINKETFMKVQNIINKKKKNNIRTRNNHILSGKIFCYKCKNIMRKKSTKNNTYLTCINAEKNKCNNRNSINYEILKSILLNNINNLVKEFFDEELLINKINNYVIERKKEIEKNLIEKQNNYKEINIYIKNIYEDKINKILSEEDFNNLLNIYNNEKNIYKEEIEKLNKKIKNIDINNFIPYKHREIKELDAEIINSFIDKIEIDNINNGERNIIITWNI